MSIAYDVVIPVYGEKSRALSSTIDACLAQTAPPENVWVVDDGSPEPIRRDGLPASDRIRLLRLEPNGGISAARMRAIAESRTPFVACINVDVLPEPRWAETLLSFAARHADAGAMYARLVPAEPNRVLSRWRMRFHEGKFDRPPGPASFAPGHAVLFRRAAIDAVGGYDVRLRRIQEDSDICERQHAAGFVTYYVGGTSCTSIQPDELGYLARKQLLRDGFDPIDPTRSTGCTRRALAGLLNRLGRNTLRARFSFLPADVAITALELAQAWRIHRAARREKRSVGGDDAQAQPVALKE